MPVETELVAIENPDGLNVILGQTHFIKTAEDVHEALVGSVPGIKFGVAFCEASGPALVRVEGNDETLKKLAARNALAVGAGHFFVVFMKDAYPINVLRALRDFGDIAQGPQDVDRVGVLHEYDEEVTRSDREGVPRSELLQGLVVAFHPDECGPGSLAERNSEFDPGYGPDECLVDVLGRLDEVGLTEDHVQPVRVLDGDEFRLDRHRQCIGPRELKSSSRKWRYATCTRKGKGIGDRSRPHGGNPRAVDDPGQRRRSGGTGRPRARRDRDPGALREPRRPGTGRGGVHGDPVSVAGVADASTAWRARGSRRASHVPGPRGQLEQGLRGRRPAPRSRGDRPRARRVT